MPSATEQLTKVEDQILETITSMQQPVIDAVKTLASKAEARVPAFAKNEKLPSADDFIVSQFVFAEKLLSNQKEFVNALLDAVKPVSTKVAADVKATARSASGKTAAAA